MGRAWSALWGLKSRSAKVNFEYPVSARWRIRTRGRRSGGSGGGVVADNTVFQRGQESRVVLPMIPIEPVR